MYTLYQKLDPLRAPELKIVRIGWFKSKHILTDEQFEYGILNCVYEGFRVKKQITTSDGTYLLKPVDFFAKKKQIIDINNGEVIGMLTCNRWNTQHIVTLNSGFTAILGREGGFFSRTMSWSNAGLENFMQLKACYKFNKAFTLTFDQRMANKAIPLALLSLLGANIMLSQQAQAAAVTI